MMGARRFKTKYWYHLQVSKYQFFLDIPTLEDETIMLLERSGVHHPAIRRHSPEERRIQTHTHIYIQGVSGGIVNILGSGSMKFSV